MQIHQTDFSTGNVYRNIMEVAVPMIIAQILNLLYNIVDRIYIGRIPEIGATALTGVGLCFPIITLITAFTYLFGNGGAPLCSMERGRGNREEAEMLMGNTFVMLIGTGAILTAIGLIFYRPILYAFGASDVTFSYAADYIRIYLLGTLFVMITLGMNPFINSQGFGNTGMLTILIGAVLNILLDPLFIFGMHMGVRGAALATIISQFCSAIWVLRFLTGKKAILNLKKSAMRISWKRVGSIVSLGMSGFFMAFTNSLVQVVCNATLQTWGGDIYVGVMTVLNSVRDIFTMPVHGLTTGASPVMSFNYGEKAYDRVKKAIKFITAVCVIYTLAGWGILKLLPEFFIRIFNSEPALLERVSRHYITISLASGKGSSRPSYLLFWLLLYGIAVYRAKRVRGTWKGKKGHLFFSVPKGSDRGTADASAASCEWSGNRWRVLGGTGFQPCRRLCMLFHHADDGIAGAEQT